MQSIEATSNPALSELIQQIAAGGNAIFITEAGEHKAVLLSAEIFSHLMRNYDYRQRPLMSYTQLQTEFQAALNQAGYDTPEKIVDLVREVKQEILWQNLNVD